jgi:pimeloyl-ACP methyl ester carboxylesterase
MATGATLTTCQPLTPQSWARSVTSLESNEAANGPCVERLVLLAGLNNGWTTPDSEQLGRFKRIKSAMITALIAWTSFRDKARLMRTVMRGSPFVVDVRLNWLDMMNTPGLEPQTVHLAGEQDDLIKKEDLYDFRSGKNFKHRVVKNTRHYDIGVVEPTTVQAIQTEFRKKKKLGRWFFGWLLPTYNISNDTGGNRRKELKEALTASWGSIQSQIGPGSLAAVPKNHVVIIRHGIRDDSHGWVSALDKTLVALDSGGKIISEKQSYGRFSMLQFLLRGARIRRVYEFMDQYVDLRAQYQPAKFHFFGHSYGTYIGCKALQEYRTCRFQHVVLANSVMAGDFPWMRVLGVQVEKVLNVRGSRDWIVAWFPGAFQSWREMRGKRPALREDLLGSAGFGGFRGVVEEGAVKGAHGAGVDKGNFSAIAEFLIHGTNTFPQEPGPNYLVGLIGRLPFIAWGAILAAVVFVAIWFGVSSWHAVPLSLIILVFALHFV